MTHVQARVIAREIYQWAMPIEARSRIKAIHVMEHLHQGHLTIRVFMTPSPAADPAPFIFTAEEL